MKEERMPNTEAVTYAIAERWERLTKAMLEDVRGYLGTERRVHLADAGEKVRELGTLAEGCGILSRG
jgi:hypothetical protein